MAEYTYDQNQLEVMRHLKDTSSLIEKAGEKIDGVKCEANILTMPDLGLPNSVSRAFGGFYTGALYSWTSDEPFVPIDATVNVCNVSIFRLEAPFESLTAFQDALCSLRSNLNEVTQYEWNFSDGNHFILLCRNTEDQWFLVMHSSACEFKKQFSGLYPTFNNWYSNRVERVQLSRGCRFLRFIRGRHAERFYEVARTLEVYNRERHRNIASLLCNDKIVEEVFNMHHYGMPSHQHVAIGCQLLKPNETGVLLTRHGAKFYLFKALEPNGNITYVNGEKFGVFPHGFGSRLDEDLVLNYTPEGMVTNGKILLPGESFSSAGAETRSHERGEEELARDMLTSCPGKITDELTPIYSYSRFGYANFKNKK